MTSSYNFLVWPRHTSRSDACIPEASPVGDSTAHVPNPWLTATKSNNNLLNFSILKDSLLILAWFSKAWPIVGWLEFKASPNN
jgi:hypothetical protein